MKNSVLLLLAVFVCHGNSANILGVFPFPSKSHWILGSALLKELARRGHDVTMMSPFTSDEPPERYTDVQLKGLIAENINVMSEVLKGNQSIMSNIITMSAMVPTITRNVIGNEELHAFLNRGKKIDLVIQLTVVMNEAQLAIGHALNATTIGFSVAGITPFQNFLTGIPAPYAYVPHMMTSFTDDMHFLQRVANTLISIFSDALVYFVFLPYQQRLLDEFFPNAPPLRELIENVDLTLLNSHIATETSRPYLPNTIQIGGYHLQETEHLPSGIEAFLNASKNGVIYFSLGTNAKSSLLPIQLQNELVEAFKQTNYDVLWVHDGQLPTKPKNLMLTSWVPQRAVLAHRNVKLFITHAGLGSTVEAVYFGIPMICIPLFGDQFKNAADSVAKGYAITINKDDITKHYLHETINEILGNPTYRKTIELKSDIYRNQEMNPMDKAVFWIEHVLKHKGAKHLKAKAAYVPLYQYLLLDVVAFLVCLLFAVVFVFYYSIKMLCKYCFCKQKKVKVN